MRTHRSQRTSGALLSSAHAPPPWVALPAQPLLTSSGDGGSRRGSVSCCGVSRQITKERSCSSLASSSPGSHAGHTLQL
eukprot:COSAG03_NODE_10379_length_654_cov_1.864865_1_plen_78_part_10